MSKEKIISEYRAERQKELQKKYNSLLYFFNGILYYFSGLATLVLTGFFLGGFMALNHTLTGKGLFVAALFLCAGLGSFILGAKLFEAGEKVGKNE